MICWLEVERVGLRGLRERRINDCWLKESEEISPLKLPGSRRLEEGLSVRALKEVPVGPGFWGIWSSELGWFRAVPLGEITH